MSSLSVYYLRQGGYIGTICFHRRPLICWFAQKVYLTDFRKIRPKGGTWATDFQKALDFESCYFRVMMGLR